MTENSENENMNPNTSLATDRKDPSFWREAWQQIRLVFYLLKDKEVPFYLKLLPFASLLYFLSPVDLIPGVLFPIVGSLDDITILLVGTKVFIELAPQHVVIKHLNTIRAQDGYSAIEEDFKNQMSANESKNIIEGEIIFEEKDPTA